MATWANVDYREESTGHQQARTTSPRMGCAAEVRRLNGNSLDRESSRGRRADSMLRLLEIG